ncbi:thermonuclease family protein [Marinomonas atlantica]|uniref:thermonuclease family protein n=1 Tax=Marinomonas atlantica TaxID=1806668 RepID=UPI000835DA84|nr:thermonuclease family protein [Marinomonas atlantica]
MLIQKKRQAILALFLCLSFPSFGQCLAVGGLQLAQVDKVIDGDTLYFKDGRKIRLVGINTPELDHEQGHHEAYALEAKLRLMALAGSHVFWQSAQENEDRYGRKLYYLFTKDRGSITSRLLSDGMGYRVAVPPNLKYQDCFEQAEQSARDAKHGVWQLKTHWQPQAGFAVVRSVLTSVTHNRGGWWLETNQDLVINIPRYAEHYWAQKDVFYLQGKIIEARGWQYQRKKRQQDRFKSVVLTVKHPQDLRRIKSSD